MASVTTISVMGFYKFQKRKNKIPGKIVGASSETAHLLWKDQFPNPVNTLHKKLVIVGGGISGLAAGYYLRQQNFEDFFIFDLEKDVGGNSAKSSNEISSYPWGAHYVPVANSETKLVLEVFKEFGVIESFDTNGTPKYNELYLCAAPLERLFIQGHWQDGLVPNFGINKTEKLEIERFFKLMESFRKSVGKDGKRAFSIPLDQSSMDPRFLRFDGMTMQDFLAQNNFRSPALSWYVNYCCRDDYGCGLSETSAWAGIHYFASRNGRATNADRHDVLTWPQGNGWLVEKFKERLGASLKPDNLISKIEFRDDKALVYCWDVLRKEMNLIVADAVIFSAPRFVANKIIQGLQDSADLKSFEYTPWMVANISLKNRPESRGAPLSWDNVSYHSKSLGYVVATHQNLKTLQKETVLTYYLPLSEGDPVSERKNALKKSHELWCDLVVGDLKKMHPEIERDILNIDVWLWGHGMIKPKVGFIWGEARQKSLKNYKNVFFAHSDMSGISIFEEALYRGHNAAMGALRYLD